MSSNDEARAFLQNFARGPDADYQRDLSRADFVYEALREAIQNGLLHHGERVREEDVAGTLGVSRTPVREALRRLETRGLVELLGTRGFVVARLTPERAAELFILREILEGSAARFAAQHAAPSEIQALYRLADDFAAAIGNFPAQARINRKIHSAIYSATHNRYVVDALNQMQDALSLLPGTTFSVGKRTREADVEHRELIAAIAARDADRAERVARAHIRGAQQARMKMMKGTADN